MRVLFWPAIVLGLALLSACGHVAANYPQAAAAAPKELPEKYEYQGQGNRLVWREEVAVHGFLSRWEKSSVLTDKLRSWAEGGNRRAARDAELFAPMGRSGVVIDLGRRSAAWSAYRVVTILS